ncbi:ABC transporter permease [Vibrio mediterranei]|uniref:ABC transporter permease n=1 Tax=Vibrio mediterranei TaxID=689 RepID=UPI00406827DD
MWPQARSRNYGQVFFDVTYALLYRECKTRFGDRRFGFLWIVLEPLCFIVLISAMFTVRGREGLGVAELPVFIATGLVPLMMFRKGVNRCIKAASSNRGLFIFPQVRPFAAVTTRVLVEIIICVCLLVVLTSGCLWLEYNAMPQEFWAIFAVLLLLSVMTLGLGLALCSLYEYVPSIATVWAMTSMPLMILSGAVVPILILVPPQYHEWLLINPVLHALELIRIYWLQAYPVLINEQESWTYLAKVALGLLFVGLAAYRATWRKMVSS